MYEGYENDYGYGSYGNSNQQDQNNAPNALAETQNSYEQNNNQPVEQKREQSSQPTQEVAYERPKEKYKPVIGINMGTWIKRYRQNRNPFRLEDVSRTNYRREDSEILRTKSDIYSISTPEFTFKISILTFNQSRDNTMTDTNHYLYIALFDNKARRNMFGATITDIGRAYNLGCEINEIVKGNETYAQIFANGKATNTQTLSSAKVDVGFCIQDFGNSYVLSIGGYDISQGKEFKRVNIPINIYHVQGIALALMEYPKLKMQAIANNIHTNESLMILLNRIQDLEDIVSSKEYSNIQKRDQRRVTMQQQQVDTRNQQAIDLEEEAEIEEMTMISMFLGEEALDAMHEFPDQNKISMQTEEFKNKLANELQAMQSEHDEYKAPEVKPSIEVKIESTENYEADIQGANDMTSFLMNEFSDNLADDLTDNVSNSAPAEIVTENVSIDVKPESESNVAATYVIDDTELVILENNVTTPVEEIKVENVEPPVEEIKEVATIETQVVEEEAKPLLESQNVIQQEVPQSNTMGDYDPGFGVEVKYIPNDRMTSFKNSKLFNFITNNNTGFKCHILKGIEIFTVDVSNKIEESVYSLITKYTLKKEIKEEAMFTIWNTDHSLIKKMCTENGNYNIELVTSVYQILKVSLRAFHNKLDDAISNALSANKPEEAKELIVQRFLDLTDELALIHKDRNSINEENFETNKYLQLFVQMFYNKENINN